MLLVSRLIAEVKRLAAESPNAQYTPPYLPTYDECMYASGECGTGSGCLIGQALQRLGVSVKRLMEFDEMQPVPGVASVVAFLVNDGVLAPPDTGEVTWLTTVQSAQDGGNFWGQCV